MPIRFSLVSLKPWVQLRRKRFWLLLLLLTYTLSGFLLLPWLAREQTETRLSALLQRPVTLESVRLNPYTLTLELRNFRIAERDGEPLLQVGRLFADLQLRSLWQRVWVLRELTLDGVQVQAERRADGSWNWQQLLPPAAPVAAAPVATAAATAAVTPAGPAPVVADPAVSDSASSNSASSDPAADAPAALPPLQLERARLTNSRLLIRDRVPVASGKQAVELPITLDLVADGFSTLPAQAAPLTLALAVASRGQLDLAAELQLNPLQVQGGLDLQGSFLDLLNPYLPPVTALTLAAGPLQLTGQYQLQTDAGGWRATVQDLDLTLNRVQLQQAGAAAPLLSLGQGQISDLQLDWPEQRVSVGALQLTDPALTLIRAANGQLQLPLPPTAAAQPAADPAAAWTLTLQRAAITGLSLDVEDQTLAAPARLQLRNTRLEASGISNQPGTAIPLTVQTELASGGTLEVGGAVTLLPALDARLQVRAGALQLAVLQPYLTPLAALQLARGSLSAELELLLQPAEPLRLQGNVGVQDFELTSGLDQSRLLAWEAVQLDNLNFALSTRQLDVAAVQIHQPYGRFLIDEQGNNNWQKLFPGTTPATPSPIPTATTTAAAPAQVAATVSAPSPAAPAVSAAAPPPLTVLVQAIEFGRGALDFGDLSLPIPFRVQMQALQGKVSTFDSQSRQAATITADGQVQDYGLARIEGSLQPLAPTSKADVGLIFRNLNLADMSPYSIKFAGRAIANGRLDLDLRYRFDKGRMRGDNKIVIADLQLGKKVPQAGALDLPLGLAVALLTGPDGKINLALPIEGDTNNPQFALGGVISQTLGNLLLKAVTSPFRLLAALVGAKDAPIDAVGFEPGSATLLPPERETLDMLARALLQRPSLALEIPAVTATAADTRALQQQAVDARAEAAIAAALKTAAVADGARQQQRLQVMEALAAQYLPALDLQAEQARWQIPDPQQPRGEPLLDITAYLASLRQQLVAVEPVPPQALQTLGETRAAAIRAYLQDGPAIAPARLHLAAAKQVKLSKQQRVRVKLELTSAAAPAAP